MSVLVVHADNFVPITQTPWGGSLIVEYKRHGVCTQRDDIPPRIGESWEVSTDGRFPSRVFNRNGAILEDVLQAEGQDILGKRVFDDMGAHCPLLLKWLHAQELLSVQVHPDNGHALLADSECGKPESWLVLDVEPGGFVYLGFRNNIHKDEIVEHLHTGRVHEVLHKVYPKPGQLFAVPPGCVHAVGPGVLIAEPQYVLRNRVAVTWRISDWGRRYDKEGRLSPSGSPRELHIQKALTALDWGLPRGYELERLLITDLWQSPRFEGNAYNRFATQAYFQPGNHTYHPLVPGSFSLFTIWRGCVSFAAENGESYLLKAGQSGLISARTSALAFTAFPEDEGLEPHVGVAFFALT